MNLRTVAIAFTLLSASPISQAQEIYRTEFMTFPLRKDATARSHASNESHIEFAPNIIMDGESVGAAQQSFTMPQSWVDCSSYIHLEGVVSGYTLYLNGRVVATCEDSFTPMDYEISRFMRVGENVVSIIFHDSAAAKLEVGFERPARELFEGSYIYVQNKLKILDYSLTLEEHTEGEHGQLFIDVIVENGFNYEETIDVGFDIYAADGKLLDFSSKQATLAGNSIDTIRFAPHLYGAAKLKWNPTKSVPMRVGGRSVTRFSDQSLYSVMLFTKRNRVNSDYIPFEVGFIIPEYNDGVLSSLGSEIYFKSSNYHTVGDATQSEKELREIKQSGVNTIITDYPQPLWFYSLCDKIGLYVIDQAAISAPESADNRAVGGSLSNNPEVAGEYLKRVKSMYYRTRNFSCVVGYSLGAESGNGYNMYKSYQWLKSVEAVRPVIYRGADGEWNNDPLNL